MVLGRVGGRVWVGEWVGERVWVDGWVGGPIAATYAPLTGCSVWNLSIYLRPSQCRRVVSGNLFAGRELGARSLTCQTPAKKRAHLNGPPYNLLDMRREVLPRQLQRADQVQPPVPAEASHLQERGRCEPVPDGIYKLMLKAHASQFPNTQASAAVAEH